MLWFIWLIVVIEKLSLVIVRIYRESYVGIKLSVYAAGHCVQLDYGPLHGLGPSTPPPLKAADDSNHNPKQNEHDN